MISDQQKSVLIVDDDPLITQTLQHLLKRMELKVLSASQWAEAMDAVEHGEPDLILLDMHMPNVDGPTLLEFIRESGHVVPVVVVSASLHEVDLDHLRELGVKRFVPKPFSAEDLRGIIEEQLGLAQAKTAVSSDEKQAAPAEQTPQAVAVSASQSVMGRGWRPSAGVRKARHRQFWTIALLCAGLSVFAVGARWAVTTLLPAIAGAMQEQSKLNQK